LGLIGAREKLSSSVAGFVKTAQDEEDDPEKRALAAQKIREALALELFYEKGEALLEEFKGRYREELGSLVQSVGEIDAKLTLVYIPVASISPEEIHRQEVYERFFREMASEYDLDLLNLAEALEEYPLDWVTLSPEDLHLSRLGNKLVADELSRYLDKHSERRSSHTFDERPEYLGPADGRTTQICMWTPHAPFRIVTNTQGLRMDYDLAFPKEKQRILVLGDSFAFGFGVSNCHAFPNLLDAKLEDREVVNAAMPSYTILQERALFESRAKYVDPDIVILQVLDNDLSDFFYYKQAEVSRDWKSHHPTAEEKKFIDEICASLEETPVQ